MKVAFIKWFDATCMGHDSLTADDLGDLSTMHSAGLYVGETKKRITLALDVNEDKSYRYVTHIPKVNIIEIRMVDGKKMKRRKRK